MSRKVYFAIGTSPSSSAFHDIDLPSGSVVRVMSSTTHEKAAKAANDMIRVFTDQIKAEVDESKSA
ncbi:MAG: hypothetical protein HQL39_12655 [Alphaproteobacteria bacterium]|nr:hypothetical protein [Alphaproteobacteria bacterium]